MEYEVKDKVFFITGAACGIGAAAVRILVEEGAKTALITGTIKAMEMMRMDEGGKGGTIINVSSVAGICQSPLLPVYWATKSAVLQFSNCIGMDDYYTRTGVRVVVICYGRTITPLLHNINSFDKHAESTFQELLDEFPAQSPESAAKGLVDTYKQARSGSTWLATAERPSEDISDDVKKAFSVMSARVYT